MKCIETIHTIDGIRIAGRNLHREGQSQAPVTLFLHGWGGKAESFTLLWQALQDAVAPYSTLLALDLPGFGESSEPSTPWNLEDYALCVVKYLDTLNISQVDIVCHSFGGRITTKLLQLRPDLIRKVVYLAPAGILHKSAKVALSRKIAHLVKPILHLPLLRTAFPTIQQLSYKLLGSRDYLQTSAVMRETFQKVIAEDTSPILSTIRKPVYIFWGRHDSYVPISDAMIMHNAIAHSHLTIFENGKHGIHFTHPAQIATEITPFLYS